MVFPGMATVTKVGRDFAVAAVVDEVVAGVAVVPDERPEWQGDKLRHT